MKPSERINQLKDYSHCPVVMMGDIESRVITSQDEAVINTKAIIAYLDEEYENKSYQERCIEGQVMDKLNDYAIGYKAGREHEKNGTYVTED